MLHIRTKYYTIIIMRTTHHLRQLFSFETVMLSMCVCVFRGLCRVGETKNKCCTKSFHSRDENRRKWRNQRNSRGDDEHIIICNVQVAECAYIRLNGRGNLRLLSVRPRLTDDLLPARLDGFFSICSGRVTANGQ